MDGNGRWATQRGLERQEGHIAGAEAVSAAVRAAAKAGVDYVTLYTFSTENWGRPEAEINAIMELFCHMVASRAEELAEQGVDTDTIIKELAALWNLTPRAGILD